MAEKLKGKTLAQYKTIELESMLRSSDPKNQDKAKKELLKRKKL